MEVYVWRTALSSDHDTSNYWKGLGQGATHSQNLHAWFAHIPRPKVIMPRTRLMRKCYLFFNIRSNPVIFLEHRWLHDVKEKCLNKTSRCCAKVVQIGSDITIVSMSYLTLRPLLLQSTCTVMESKLRLSI